MYVCVMNILENRRNIQGKEERRVYSTGVYIIWGEWKKGGGGLGLVLKNINHGIVKYLCLEKKF